MTQGCACLPQLVLDGDKTLCPWTAGSGTTKKDVSETAKEVDGFVAGTVLDGDLPLEHFGH